jgi:NADH:ubiquinone oxidoreductase subunit 2 (subunit N)
MMYIQPPAEGAPALPSVPWPLTVVLLVCLAGVLLLGLYPGPFVDLARAALPALP